MYRKLEEPVPETTEEAQAEHEPCPCRCKEPREENAEETPEANLTANQLSLDYDING